MITTVRVYPEKEYAVGGWNQWVCQFGQVTGKLPCSDTRIELKQNSQNKWVPIKVTIINRSIELTIRDIEESRIPTSTRDYIIEQFETGINISEADLRIRIPAGTLVRFFDKNKSYILEHDEVTSRKLLR